MADCREESGWTSYFEYFLCNNRNNNENVEQQEEEKSGNLFCNSESPAATHSHLVSDAASSVATKKYLSDPPVLLTNDQMTGSSNFKASCKKLSFKKKRSFNYKVSAAISAFDDALEDTATSPLNSPKVCNLIPQGTMNRYVEKSTEISERGGNKLRVETSEYTTELKRRGLCLVPVSTLANYLA